MFIFVGYPEEAPFAGIHVGAAAAPAVLSTLRAQLHQPETTAEGAKLAGGTLMVPVDPHSTNVLPEQREESARLQRHAAERGHDHSHGAHGGQLLVRVQRTGEDSFNQTTLCAVRYVPLTDERAQKEHATLWGGRF